MEGDEAVAMFISTNQNLLLGCEYSILYCIIYHSIVYIDVLSLSNTMLKNSVKAHYHLEPYQNPNCS